MTCHNYINTSSIDTGGVCNACGPQQCNQGDRHQLMGPRRVCSVCCHAVAQYTCPRCHRAYCGSACYKEHSHQCTEAFFREQATSQLKATRADGAQTKHMLQILQRMHRQDMDSEDGSDKSGNSESDNEGMAEQLPPALRSLIDQAALEGEQFEVHPSQLTADVVAELEQLSLKGQLSHLVAAWQPWWTTAAAGDLQLSASGQLVVQELHTSAPSCRAAAVADMHSSSEGNELLPSAVETQQPHNNGEQQQRDEQLLPLPPSQPLPSLARLAGPGFQPSPLLPWQLLQLLVAYAAVKRWYNGEPEAAGWESVEQLLLLSPPLMQQRAPAAAVAADSEAALVSTATAAAVGDGQQQKPPPPQQQQQQQVDASVVQLAAPDSVRVANMQLAAAAADMSSSTTAGSSRQRGRNRQQPSVAAGAVPSELRLLLQVGLSDALQLLQLGRSAVVLALTDTQRLLEQGLQELKQQRQQHQQHKAEERAGKPRSAGAGAATHLAGPWPQLDKQQITNCKALCRQLFLAGRKVHFFTVWSNEQPPSVFERLILELQLELHEQERIQVEKPTSPVCKTGFLQRPLNVNDAAPSSQLQNQQHQLKTQQQQRDKRKQQQQQQQWHGHGPITPNSAASNTSFRELEATCTVPCVVPAAVIDDLYGLD